MSVDDRPSALKPWDTARPTPAAARRPVLFGALQAESNHLAALPRWNELPVRVPLAPDAPLRRE